MSKRILLAAIPLIVAVSLAGPAPAGAQIPKKLKDAVQNAVEDEALIQIDRLIREAIRCYVGDPMCYDESMADGEEVIFTDDQGEIIYDDEGFPETDRDDAAAQAGVDLEDGGDDVMRDAEFQRPGEGVWANYDFVPGEEVFFYEDYLDDNVGDFPRRLKFLRGNWEIVEWQGQRLLRNTGPRGSAFEIPLPETLPERFTIEIDAHFPHGNHQLVIATVPPVGGGANWTKLKGNFFQIGVDQGTGVMATRPERMQGAVSATNRTRQLAESVVPVRIMVDGPYAKVYVESDRVANVPNAELPRGETLYIENIYNASDQNPMYLGAIRVAGGGRDLYDALEERGRVATRGILFDVDSDRIRPESGPTLEEIGVMLQEHADLRIRIEGHTDSDGDEAYNLDLSNRRAESVKRFLIEIYGIDGSRLEAEGLGESDPVESNDTPEAKQQNRRVELVRL